MFEVRKPLYGANYYPEAFDRSEIDKDLDRMVELGLNCVRIAEFAWGVMEPEEGKFDFSIFRETVDKCRARGIAVVMGTPSACPPRWLEEKYPEISYMNQNGVRATHGGRRNVCPNNEVYRKYCARIVEEMAKEFCHDDNIVGWQIDNEIEPETLGSSGCCCPSCRAKFPQFIKEMYDGDIDKLNLEWGNAVWSNKFDSFEQLDFPNPIVWNHPGLQYHWGLFQDRSQNEFIKVQADILRKYVSVPIGHDSMPIFNLDYNILSSNMDVMMFNQYSFGNRVWDSAFWYDMMRALKGKPFWLTETSCCWNGSAEANYMRPKHFNKANVWLAVSRGAELVNYWLWRSHYGGHELMHGAVVSSCGRPSHVAGEIRELSAEFDQAGPLLTGTAPVKPEIAMHVSSNTYEMFRFQKIIPGLEYRHEIRLNLYRPIVDQHYAMDIIAPDTPIEDYKVILTPFMLNLDEGNVGARMVEWVKNGGTWIVGPLSDIRNRAAAKYIEKPMGMLEDVTGSRLEFSLPRGMDVNMQFASGKSGKTIDIVYDAFTVSGDTKAMATYTNGDFLEGYAAITETPLGKGKIVLLGTMPDNDAVAELVRDLATEQGIKTVCRADASVFVTHRKGEAGEMFIAVETDHIPAKVTVPFDCEDMFSGTRYPAGTELTLAPYGVLVTKKI